MYLAIGIVGLCVASAVRRVSTKGQLSVWQVPQSIQRDVYVPIHISIQEAAQ